ncbi:hypothetical protein LXA43DRAFT_1031315 [Ganoderma leucocontextum]|nr:hypothetical protein LXA43DRAFT_1031315 [Ganoderma leucocontextum]
MTRVLGQDLGSRGINVNTIAPRTVDIDLFRNGRTGERINFTDLHCPQTRARPSGGDQQRRPVSGVSDQASWVNRQTADTPNNPYRSTWSTIVASYCAEGVGGCSSAGSRRRHDTDDTVSDLLLHTTVSSFTGFRLVTGRYR